VGIGLSMLLRRTPRLASERGSMLVEVLVGTILLALTTTAVLDGLDGAQDSGLRNKNRSVSATLAQQDIERMRSMPPTALSNYRETHTETVGGVDYTVVSRTDWVVDATGVQSCTTSDDQAEYLKLTSTVSAPSSVQAPVVVNTPVTAASLLTPPPGTFEDDAGTATVKLSDRNGAPLPDVSVHLSGPGSEGATTNDAGCAIFAFIDSGTWTTEVLGSWVSWEGEMPAESPVIVAAGKTSLTQLEVDHPASLRAEFETPAGGPVTWTGADDRKSIRVVNSKLPTGFKTFPGDSLDHTDADNLFPFLDGYGVFVGDCEANNPAVWDTTYFQTSGKGYATPDPGGPRESVDVVVPEIEITVRRMNGSTVNPFSQAQVYIKELDTSLGCTAVIDNVSNTSSGSNSYTSDVFTVPVPFGNFEVCAATRTTSGSSWRRAFTGASAPTHRNLTTTALATANRSVSIDTPTSGSNSGCFLTP
jgi:type II secretory pathway pseudopilin PulG